MSKTPWQLRAARPSAPRLRRQPARARHGFRSWRALAEIDRRRTIAEQRRSDRRRCHVHRARRSQLARLLQRARRRRRCRHDLLNARGRRSSTPKTRRPGRAHVAAEWATRLGAVLLASGADPTPTIGDSGHTAMSGPSRNATDFARARCRRSAKADLFCAAAGRPRRRPAVRRPRPTAPGASRIGSSRSRRRWHAAALSARVGA